VLCISSLVAGSEHRGKKTSGAKELYSFCLQLNNQVSLSNDLMDKVTFSNSNKLGTSSSVHQRGFRIPSHQNT